MISRIFTDIRPQRESASLRAHSGPAVNDLAGVGSQAGAKSYGQRGEGDERPTEQVELARPVLEASGSACPR